jgi:heptosyltransferase-1
MKKILIVKTSSLGDIIHAFPVVNFLKKEFPDSQIDWVVEKSFSEIVRAHPSIHRVIEVNTKGWRKGVFRKSTWQEMRSFKSSLTQEIYDVVIDLQGNTKSAWPTFLSRSAKKIGFGSKTVHEWPNLLVTNQRFNPPLNLNVREENLYLVQHFFQRYGDVDETVNLNLTLEQKQALELILKNIPENAGKKILICSGSAWKNKQLSEQALEELLVEIGKNEKAFFLFAWGSLEEQKVAQNLHERFKNSQVLEKLSFPVLQNFMQCMDLIIAMDSLPLHLAGTTKTSTYGVFGASSENKYKPLGDRHYSLQGECPYGILFERRCPKLRTCPTGACIKHLDGKKLYQPLKN